MMAGHQLKCGNIFWNRKHSQYLTGEFAQILHVYVIPDNLDLNLKFIGYGRSCCAYGFQSLSEFVISAT